MKLIFSIAKMEPLLYILYLSINHHFIERLLGYNNMDIIDV